MLKSMQQIFHETMHVTHTAFLLYVLQGMWVSPGESREKASMRRKGNLADEHAERKGDTMGLAR
jgi:hypothetical protein